MTQICKKQNSLNCFAYFPDFSYDFSWNHLGRIWEDLWEVFRKSPGSLWEISCRICGGPKRRRIEPKTGSNRAQDTATNLGDVCWRSLFFDIFWGFGVFNYSKIANVSSWTYSNTVWIISGTSKTSSKYTPRVPYLLQKYCNEWENMDTFYKHIMCCKPGNLQF